jgi:hypothetical protein
MDLDYPGVTDQVKPKPPQNRDGVLYPEHVHLTACLHPWHRAKYPLGPTCPTCGYVRYASESSAWRGPPGTPPGYAAQLCLCLVCGNPCLKAVAACPHCVEPRQ